MGHGAGLTARRTRDGESTGKAIADEVRAILLSDLSQACDMHALADRFGVSPNTLNNCFKSVYGSYVPTYLREARMREAAFLLERTNLRVGEIATRVGYANQSKFAAAFARICGASPTTYRKEARLRSLKRSS